MSADKLHIKNMVCRRCVMAVEEICRDLGIDDAEVSLGSVGFRAVPDPGVMDAFFARLRAIGFEPLRRHELVMLESIKAATRRYARLGTDGGGDGDKDKLSVYLGRALDLDFRHASRLFSSLEGRTLQCYLMAQRVEYVKELLTDNELTLAKIADKAGFSSVAHLSRAFKKSQGVTISEFREGGGELRRGVDEV